MRNSLVMDLLIALLYLRGTIWLWWRRLHRYRRRKYNELLRM